MDSPTSSVGDSPKFVSTTDKRDLRLEGSPRQDSSLCQRRSSKSSRQHGRHTPYDRSPGGSTCTSSDDSGAENECTNNSSDEQSRKKKRNAANDRERRRMHTVNSAFDQLRDLVPTYPSNRKLSKIDTLKLACAYIQDLTSLLRNPASVVHGEDVKLYPIQCNEGFMQGGCGSPTAYPGVHVKSEFGINGDFTACSYQQYRLQPAYISVSARKELLGRKSLFVYCTNSRVLKLKYRFVYI